MMALPAWPAFKAWQRVASRNSPLCCTAAAHTRLASYSGSSNVSEDAVPIVDVAIVGGGMVGAALAALIGACLLVPLAQAGAAWLVTVML
jgi:hypothetical protein